MKAASFSEKLVPVCQTGRRNIAEDFNLNIHIRENLNSNTVTSVSSSINILEAESTKD
jgi:hypothetical protein